MKYSYLYGSGGKPVAYHLNPYSNKKRILLASCLCFIFISGIIASQIMHTRLNIAEAAPELVSAQSVKTSSKQKIDSLPPVNENEPKELTWQKQPSIDLTGWFKSHKGNYGVTVYSEGNLMTNIGGNEQHFMASIYKLYVAYIGYQKIDRGEWNENDQYVGDWSRGKCLDEMIRSSNSPCGEKMSAEIGVPNIQSQLNEYGLENTSFKKLVTSSEDVANILIRLQKNLDLSPSSTTKIMDSMLGQIHRDAMPKGFGQNWKVYDKVGFEEHNEYHDVAMVVTPRGKTYIVAILSTGAGTTNLVDLAATIKNSISE